jgi:O-antigen/teichoic acid export membrane protein
MLAEKAETPPVSEARHRSTFFRQSGWLMTASVGGGLLMWAVHFLSKRIPDAEYGVFGTLLAVVIFIPGMPLQMVLAQQTAKALAAHREGELAGILRLFWIGTTALWLAGTVVVLCFQTELLAQWKMTSPVALWMTLPALLLMLWAPVFWGMLQGRQNFLWLGWSMLSNGIGRVAVSTLAVLAIVSNAAGMMTGVLAGLIVAVSVAIWMTRDLWGRKSDAFDWRGLLRQIVPLMLGFAAFQFLFTADMMFVKSYFSKDEAAFYSGAGTLSRALLWLVMPLATVMFPRLVQSAARSEKTNLMGIVLLGTALLSACGAVGLTVIGPWVVRLVFKPSFVEVATTILPWYAWAMLPIALTNVLLNHLLAHGAYRVVVPLVVLVMGYAFALTRFHESLVMVLQTLGVFGLGALGVCAWFSYIRPPSPALSGPTGGR